MKKIYITAKCNFNSELNDTKNHLDVEISFPRRLIDVNELEVHIYSDGYEFLGSGCVAAVTDKISKKVSLDISSGENWEEQIINVYVFVNGKAKWHCEMCVFPSSSDNCDKKVLHQINENTFENFFAENLSLTSCWNGLYSGQFKVPLIRGLIEKLFVFNNEIKKTHKSEVPHLLVIGEDENCGFKNFTSRIVEDFISGDISSVFKISLTEIIDGTWSSDDITAMTDYKAVILEVSTSDYNEEGVNLINYFIMSLATCEVGDNHVFIICGTKERIDVLNAKCFMLKNQFNTSNTIFLSSLGHDIDDDEIRFRHDLCENKCAEPKSEVCSAEKTLDEMVGLKRVKEDMRATLIMSEFNKKRIDMRLQKNTECINHMLFLGNPGTGKSTVARLVAQIYHDMGLLSKGQTVETCRAKLVGEFIGLTEKKTLEVIEKARGGVLFIDDAYTLIQCNDNHSNDFGKEVVNTLLTVLSEPNPDMIVIMAGYEDKMDAMLKTNRGLRDRFPIIFHFDDYTAEELMEITCRKLNSNNYRLTDAAYHRLHAIIEKSFVSKDIYFSNGRWVQNFINQGIIKSMARRVMLDNRDMIGVEALCNIEETDIIDAEHRYFAIYHKTVSSRAVVGFRA